MVSDALDGRIDLIVTKSVSRFARNTVDSLTTIRKLKEHGTEVYFEKENIWTAKLEITQDAIARKKAQRQMMENFMETLQSLPEQVEILVFERLGKIKRYL